MRTAFGRVMTGLGYTLAGGAAWLARNAARITAHCAGDVANGLRAGIDRLLYG